MHHRKQHLYYNFIISTLLLCSLSTLTGQHLPEGRYHDNREREIDILHYRADLRFNFADHQVFGQATVTFRPLRRLQRFSLDAIRLAIESVSLVQERQTSALPFETANQALTVDLGQFYPPDDTLTISIRYSATPNAGMYFLPDQVHQGQYFVYTYGEGGLHANWLPIYNSPNDKFTSEMIVRVPPPYSVVSNGSLINLAQHDNGDRSFHWKQALPHSDYLIAIYIGEFDKGDLPPAFGSIPLSYWVPKGRKEEGAYAFRNTTAMVEFFSRRFDYRYPWEKYDQIAIPDYAIGAMEHTSVTGHRASVLRREDAPENFGGPDFEHYHDVWSADGTIAHELAHHWFGDNLTCRNLSYIWLNESFATYLQMLWDEEALGEDRLLLDRQEAFDEYLDYVNTKHLIRPLEYHYFEKVDEIYNEEHTYFKGAIILHMLRKILGDEAFFHACSYYLKKHEFSNVESHDFKIAIEEATGRNLDWFFEDWVYGGGHPVFEVSYSYLSGKQLLDLCVTQIQPLIEGQDLFALPVEIGVATTGGLTKSTIFVEEQEEHFLLPCAENPLMVSFDGQGALVAEVNFEKTLPELLYQIENDQLPGRIRALREAARSFPSRPETLDALRKILEGPSFWGLKAEAALLLGSIRTKAAETLLLQALQNKEYRIRKAAVLALPHFPPDFAESTCKNIIRRDSHSDVVATAIVALAKTRPDESNIQLIRQQLNRPSWYDEITIACLNALEISASASSAADIRPYAAAPHNQHVRNAALKAWAHCSPEDPNLHEVLIEDAQSAPYGVKLKAIEWLGKLHVSRGRSILKQIISESGDLDFRVTAETALREIERVVGQTAE